MADTEKQLAEQAGRVDRVEDKSKQQDTRLDSHDRELKLLREQMSKMGDMGGPRCDARDGQEGQQRE